MSVAMGHTVGLKKEGELQATCFEHGVLFREPHN
jgi:hypothetical protein